MALSYIMSNSVFVFSLFTGVYLMSMGMGVLLVEKINMNSSRLMSLMILNSLAGILLANPGITGIITINELARYLLRAREIDLLPVLLPLGILLTALVGIVSGAEIPIFSKISENERWHPSKPVIGILTSDYFGAAVGIIAFTFFLNPFAGLFNGVFLSQMAALTVINSVYFSMNISKRILPAMMAVNIYVLVMFLLRTPFANWIDTISSF